MLVGPGMAVQLWWYVDGRDREGKELDGNAEPDQATEVAQDNRSRCIQEAIAVWSEEARLSAMRLTVFTLILSILLQCGGLIVSAAQEGESERNMSQSVTATVGGNTLHAITDPVVYWEVANGGSLSDYQIKFNQVDENATVIYTPWYPNTKTGRAVAFLMFHRCVPADWLVCIAHMSPMARMR